MNKIFILLSLLSSLTIAMPGDAEKPIEIEAESVVVDESTGFNQFMGDAVVTQGSLVLSAELIEVQTSDEEVGSMVAKGSQQKPAKYTQSQPNQARFIEASAIEITYDVEKGIVFLIGDAHLVQGFDSFSGETLEYDINNDKVFVKGSEDGVKRVKFKIAL
jgi:lipopolysaccharide export system protein LptA